MFWFGILHMLGVCAVVWAIVRVAADFAPLLPFLARPKLHEALISLWAIVVTLLAILAPILLASNMKWLLYGAGVLAGGGLITAVDLIRRITDRQRSEPQRGRVLIATYKEVEADKSAG
jgi:bacteriorhodopsin